MSCSLQGLLETYLDIGTFLSFDRSPGAGPLRPRCNGTSSPRAYSPSLCKFSEPFVALASPVERVWTERSRVVYCWVSRRVCCEDPVGLEIDLGQGTVRGSHVCGILGIHE